MRCSPPAAAPASLPPAAAAPRSAAAPAPPGAAPGRSAAAPWPGEVLQGGHGMILAKNAGKIVEKRHIIFFMDSYGNLR